MQHLNLCTKFKQFRSLSEGSHTHPTSGDYRTHPLGRRHVVLVVLPDEALCSVVVLLRDLAVPPGVAEALLVVLLA